MANCIRHQMPDGTIMDGPTHGPGQVCVEYDHSITNRRKSMRRRISSRRTARSRAPIGRRGRAPIARRGRPAVRRGRPAVRRGGVARRGVTARRGRPAARRGRAMVHRPGHGRFGNGMSYRRGGASINGTPSRRASRSSAFRQTRKLQGP